MALALGLGLLGTFLLFWGLRLPLDLAARRGNRHRQLSVVHFRQLQETVIRRSGSLAVCSLLLLADVYKRQPQTTAPFRFSVT